MDGLAHTGVVNLEQLHRVEADFSDATSLGVITVDGRGAPATPACGFSQFCLAIRRDPLRRTRCHACDAHGGLQAAIEGRPYIYHCHTGLVDFSIPIIDDSTYIGAILCGQARLDGDDTFTYLMEPDLSWREDPELVRLHDQVPVIKRAKIESAATMLTALTQSMVENITSATLIPLAGPGEPMTGHAPLVASPAGRPFDATASTTTFLPGTDVPPLPSPTEPTTQPSTVSASGLPWLVSSLFTPTQTTPPDEFTDLQLSIENEDLAGANRALSAWLDLMFATSGRNIGQARLIPLEDRLANVAESICPAAGNGVRRAIHRRRTKLGTHLGRYKTQLYLESLLHIIITEAAHAHPRRTLASLLNLIERNPARTWTLQDAATYLGLSSSRVSKRFKAHTGRTFVAYINDKRIERARLMLAHTAVPVIRVAREVGLGPNYFSRLFKLATGLSPTAYRDQHSQANDTWE